jgi:D-serine deaminase-like pyridoxal phosphate-dependent protein
MKLTDARTPCLLLDYKKLKTNAQKMGERAASLGVKLRPHIKTHKCIEIGLLQTGEQKERIAVSTLEEARVFAAAGFRDVLYAVPIEPGKIPAAIELSKQCERLRLITDDLSVPPILNKMAWDAGIKIELLVDVDCGYRRTGVDPKTAAATELVESITDLSHLHFGGLLTHAGHAYRASSKQELLSIARQERDVMVDFASELRRVGLDSPLISVGSTPTISTVDHLKGIDEARPGNYIFYDVFQATLGTCHFQDCAITVLASIVSRNSARRQVVCDAGAIALSKDPGPTEFNPTCGFGRVLDEEGIDLGFSLTNLSQEHGVAFIENGAVFESLKVGVRIRILVNHSCLSAAQHDFYHVLENGRIIAYWKRFRGW